MKSFVNYPLEFENLLFPETGEGISGKFIAHYKLFKKVAHLNGAIVKCGVSVQESFSRFKSYSNIVAGKQEQKMIVFEKLQPVLEEVMHASGEVSLKVKERDTSKQNNFTDTLIKSGLSQNIEFIPGTIHESIPNYLIENPDLKIALLNIDLDEYDTTLTTLEFLYPRLMPGGILVLDNFYKYLTETSAVKDYFAPAKVTINNFSVNNGPHYIVKP